ncbi:MAG: methylmalonyl-CoA mutase [Chloroflexi bacterium]|nr:MAG: methylmalonyl-CoA mutase [Chloroflexota bacterium]
MSDSLPENGDAKQLFSDFTPPTYEEWVAATVQSLKGRPFDKLASQTDEGITLQPMYRQENIADLPHLDTLPGQFPFVRGTSSPDQQAPWLITQELSHSTPAAYNAALKNNIALGQTAVFLTFDPPTLQGLDPDQSSDSLVGFGGLSLSSLADVARLFDGIDITKTPVMMQPEKAFFPLSALFIAYFEGANIDLSALSGCAGVDPLGILVRRGMSWPIGETYDRLVQIVRWSAANAPGFQPIGVFTDNYHDSGANAVQELAFGMATAVSYIRALQDRGIEVDEAASSIRFIFAIGSNFFMEVAKLRAARMVWAQIVAAFGGSEDAQKLRMHTRTSSFNKTKADPYVNMLRVTTEAFAGAVGGTDSQHVAPFNETSGSPDDFSQRIARNVQIILQEEANLTQLTDPAGGSYYIEFLTDQIANKSWEMFQEIEANSGMLAALEAGLPQEWVLETAVSRAKNLATRNHVLVGTNMYPNLEEEKQKTKNGKQKTENERRATINSQQLIINQSDLGSLVEASQAGATLGQLWGIQPEPGIMAYDIPMFPRQRLARPFEALREKAEVYWAEQGHCPRIFMANIGPLANHKPRADFSVGFFEVGGFEMMRTDGFDDVDAAVDAVVASGETAVIICGTDADYPLFVPPFVQQLKDKQPEATVILAGYPKAHVESFKAAGVDIFIHIKADCLKINQTLQSKIFAKQQDKSKPKPKNSIDSNLILPDIDSLF